MIDECLESLVDYFGYMTIAIVILTLIDSIKNSSIFGKKETPELDETKRKKPWQL